MKYARKLAGTRGAAVVAFLNDETVAELNQTWARSEPERIHQSRGDRIKLRLEVSDDSGVVSKWTLRLGGGERTLSRGSGVMPDAIVSLEEGTLERVLTSDDPAALSTELAQGTIRVRGNTEKLYENLGDVLAISDGPTRAGMAAYQDQRSD